jgi:hypothetical protein
MSTAKPPRTLIWLVAAVLAGSATAWGAAALVVKVGDPRPQNHDDPLYSYQAPR